MTGMPSPSGHCVVIDDEPGSEGFAVRCVPHGSIGAWESRLAAFLGALEHDHEMGGGSL